MFHEIGQAFWYTELSIWYEKKSGMRYINFPANFLVRGKMKVLDTKIPYFGEKISLGQI